MNKEPLSLYIFRILLACGLFFFMGLLYWSSLLIEENIQLIREELVEIHQEIDQLKNRGFLKGGATEDRLPQGYVNRQDPSLPNLLTPDPFYETTLPKMLGEDFKPHGTFHKDVLGRVDNLHPFGNWADGNTWWGMCSVAVAKEHFGIYETMAPDMALKMEERINPETGIPEHWVHLRPGVYWQPLKKNLFSEEINLAPHFLKKHPVTAYDFKFYIDALMNPHNQEPGAVALRTYYEDLDHFEVIDDYTFVVRWKTREFTVDGKKVKKPRYIAKQLTGGLRPLASFVYQYFADGTKIIDDKGNLDSYKTSEIWAQNFSNHWAKNVITSSGPWVFKGMSERQVSFERNPDYYEPLEVLAEETVVFFKDSFDGIWQDFKAGKIDTYSIQPEQLLELQRFLTSDIYKKQEAEKMAIKRLDYLARQYFYIGWNETRPYFNTKKVRQAMTMGINRQRIVKEFLNGLGEEITGTFFKNSPSYDSSIIPLAFDVRQAKRLLEEEGWYDSDGDGIIDKEINGVRVPFKFSLTYYVKNPTNKSICEYVATALKELGIQVNLNGVDIADLSAVFDDKDFDALCLGWGLGSPPEDPRQLWHSSGAKEKGSSNAVGFANSEIDRIIDELEYEYDEAKRIELYHAFDKILYDEQPYTFLYTPKIAFLYREYVQNVFIPADRKDLIPNANAGEPSSSIFWLKKE